MGSPDGKGRAACGCGRGGLGWLRRDWGKAPRGHRIRIMAQCSDKRESPHHDQGKGGREGGETPVAAVEAPAAGRGGLSGRPWLTTAHLISP